MDSEFVQFVATGMDMRADWYQEEAAKFSRYPDVGDKILEMLDVYGTSDNDPQWVEIITQGPLLAAGFFGEAGEVANIVKKIIRNSLLGGMPPDESAVADELGDALWYLSAIADLFGYSLSEVMLLNLSKLEARLMMDQIATENRGRRCYEPRRTASARD